MFGIAGKIVTFLIALGIIGFAWKYFTKNIYETEVLSVKNYYGRLTINDEAMNHYMFVKMEFFKPWYASKAKIFPKYFKVFSDVGNGSFCDEYEIIENLKSDHVFLPRVQIMPRVISVDGNETVFTLAPDLVAKQIGRYKTAETFDDIRDSMLKIPFILDMEDEVKKTFVFRLVGKQKGAYSTRTMGVPYKITGHNINEGPYVFHSYMLSNSVRMFSPTDQAYIYIENSRRLILKEEYEKALQNLKKAKDADPNNYLPTIIEGIINIIQEESELGNEKIKSHISLLSLNDTKYILPHVIKVNMVINTRDNVFIEFWLKFALKKFPQSIIFKELETIYYFTRQNHAKAFEIFEQITPFLIDSELYYKSLIRKGFVCYHLKKYKISNYYLLENMEKLQKDESVRPDVIECVNLLIGANYYFTNETAMAQKYFSKLSNESCYREPADHIIGGERPGILYGSFLYDITPPQFPRNSLDRCSVVLHIGK